MSTKKRQKIIAIDIDDVLAANAEGFIEFSNTRLGHKLKKDDYQEEWAKVWNVSLEEAMRRAEEFHISGVVADYQYKHGALDVLQKLSQTYKLITVTSRRSILKDHTTRWLERHFPGVFDDVCYAGIWEGDKTIEQMINQTKADVCLALGADYLIDDQIKHCFGAASVGMKSLLFGEYGWNQTTDRLPENVIRVKDWKDVEEYFDGES
jgi:5'(3')-deoxyribonucleotidase